ARPSAQPGAIGRISTSGLPTIWLQHPSSWPPIKLRVGEVLACAVIAVNGRLVDHMDRLQTALHGVGAHGLAADDAALGRAVDAAVRLGDAEEFRRRFGLRLLLGCDRI